MNPDSVESRSVTRFNQANEAVRKLALAARSDGMRDGLELAAGAIGKAADACSVMVIDSYLRDTVSEVLEGIRDNIRMAIFEIPDADEL